MFSRLFLSPLNPLFHMRISKYGLLDYRKKTTIVLKNISQSAVMIVTTSLKDRDGSPLLLYCVCVDGFKYGEDLPS